MTTSHYKALCIGAGPAGLTAGYLLAKAGQPVLVIEQDAHYVGGISRTESYKGYLCDIGGHRFFSKSKEVEALWDEILGDDFIQRPRKSRIFYNRKFFNYPLSAMDALLKLGIIQSTLCVLSYGKAYLFPNKNPKNFQEWVVAQFGYRLFSIFFKTYTEKVWGMACTEISADWAAQRIKGLSLGKAIMNALLPKKKRPAQGDTIVKTLIDHFRYPKRGPGKMWETAVPKMSGFGGAIHMGETVTGCHFDGMQWQVTTINSSGKTAIYTAEHVISSMPLSTLLKNLTPALPAGVLAAANSLNYRDFLIVSLIVRDTKRFDDNWIYIHDPSVKVGRIQNFKSWSPFMVPDAANNCLGLEYFCFERDGLWRMSDAELIALATNELVALGLAHADEVLDGFVVRQPKAYPVYDAHYKQHTDTIKMALSALPTLHPVGRNGMHRYNNQDHSMMTAMLTVKNILNGATTYDTWLVNEDAEYHEEMKPDAPAAGRQVPMKANA